MSKDKYIYRTRFSKNYDPWEGFPPGLKNMLLALFDTGGYYCIKEAIRYLNDNEVDKWNTKGDAKLNYVRWADRFFTEMYPFYSFAKEEDWRESAAELEKILTRTESYICDLAGDYDSLRDVCKNDLPDTDRSGLVNITQRVDFYWCTLFWFQHKEDEFRSKLKSILKSTKQNILHVLSCENAAELMDLSFKGMDGMMEIEFNYWEPLSWVYHEGGSSEFPHELIPMYEDYIRFLSVRDCGSNKDICIDLQIEAERNLQQLYISDFERMEDEGEIPAASYAYYFEENERKIRESEERVVNLKGALTNNDTFIGQLSGCINTREHDSGKSIWERAKMLLDAQITPLAYNTWISPLKYDHIDADKGCLYVSWPNQANLIKYISSNYLNLIEACVRETTTEIHSVRIISVEDLFKCVNVEEIPF